MPPGEEVVNDYRFLRLSLKAHPVHFVRNTLSARGVARNEELAVRPPNRRLSVAGLVLVRQRPGSAKGVIFMTLEDETGVANVIVWAKTFERYRAVVLGARFVIVRGVLQREFDVTHIVAEHIEDATHLLAALSPDRAPVATLARVDEVKRPQQDIRDKRIDAGAARVKRMRADSPPQLAFADLDVPAQALPRGRNFR